MLVWFPDVSHQGQELSHMWGHRKLSCGMASFSPSGVLWLQVTRQGGCGIEVPVRRLGLLGLQSLLGRGRFAATCYQGQELGALGVGLWEAAQQA